MAQIPALMPKSHSLCNRNQIELNFLGSLICCYFLSDLAHLDTKISVAEKFSSKQLFTNIPRKSDTLSSVVLIRYPYLEDYPPRLIAEDGTELGKRKVMINCQAFE